LVGDHQTEIVATGMNEEGKLTLDAFRPVPPSQGKGLEYRPICQLVADEVSIEQSDRPEGYSTDQKDGASYPILAYLRDPDSQNVMDLVRIRYAWNDKENRYVPGSAEKIPGEEVRQAQLKALYTSGGEDAFEQFISGSWVQVIPPSRKNASETYGGIINFDTRSRTISLLTGNTQEAYVWRESHRTIYNSMRAIGENATVLQIQLIRTFSIVVDTPSTIEVKIIGNEAGDSPTATYTRITDDIRARLLGGADSQISMLNLSLQGRFLGAQGQAVDFRAPDLTWSDSTGQKPGTYVLFSLGGSPVMSVRFHRGPRQRDRIVSWLVGYEEHKEPGRVVRVLTLSPIRLTVNGYEDANGDALVLQQYQSIPSKK
ncbi:MAG TPA: pallilysin-related adhesin, partial [Spirochaetia bacterium]